MTATEPSLPAPWRAVADPDAVAAAIDREAARGAEEARRLHPACELAVSDAEPTLAAAFLREPAILLWTGSPESWRRKNAPAAARFAALAMALGLALDRERAWIWHRCGLTMRDGIVIAVADLPVVAADPHPVRCAEMPGPRGRLERSLVVIDPDGAEQIFPMDGVGSLSNSDFRDDAVARSLIAAQRALGFRLTADGGTSMYWDSREVLTVSGPDERVAHWTDGATPVDGHPGYYVLADGAVGTVRRRTSGAHIRVVKRLGQARPESHDDAEAVLAALRASDPRGLRHGAASLMLHDEDLTWMDARFALAPVLTAAGWVPVCEAGAVVAEADTGAHRCTVRRLDSPLGGGQIAAFVSLAAEPVIAGALPWRASIALTNDGPREHILRAPGEPLDAAGLALLRTAAGLKARPRAVRHDDRVSADPALVRTARGWSPAVVGAAGGAWEVVETNGRIAAVDAVGRIAWIMRAPRGAVARPILFADAGEPFRLLARVVAERGATLGRDWAAVAARHGCVLRQGRVMLVDPHPLDGLRVEHDDGVAVLLRDPVSPAAPAGSTEAWTVRREADGRALGTLSITVEGCLRSSPRGGEGRRLLAAAEAAAQARLAATRPVGAAAAVLEVLRDEAWVARAAAGIPPERLQDLAERAAAAALATEPRGRRTGWGRR